MKLGKISLLSLIVVQTIVVVSATFSPSFEGNAARKLIIPHFEDLWSDEDNNGIPDVFPDFDFGNVGGGWFSGEGESNFGDFTMPDWTSLDWADFSIEEVDWPNLDWDPEAWTSFLESWWTGMQENNVIEFCPILEAAIGISSSFGFAGDCTCLGELGTDLSIQCSFLDECIPGTPVCGSIAASWKFDDGVNMISATACLDAPTSDFEEVCFTYGMTLASMNFDQSCSASYGGNACSCEIENFCFAVDCSAFLPGAKMDTCQFFKFDDEEDAVLLVPNFPVFDESFSSLPFESVDWPAVDWDNMDWNNFGFDQVDWTNTDWSSTTWEFMLGDGTSEAGVCPLLTRILSMSADTAAACECSSGSSAFNLLCSFDEACTPDASLCADIAMEFGFTDVGAINGGLCVDFKWDSHPKTCIDYTIPIANQAALPTCGATYDGKACGCKIDSIGCVLVDCSAHEPMAVMDTCQVIRVQETPDVVNLVPKFSVRNNSILPGEPAGTEPIPEVAFPVMEDATPEAESNIDENPNETAIDSSGPSVINAGLESISEADDESSGTFASLGLDVVSLAFMALFSSII